MQSIAVTGATGFIGQHLLRQLAKRPRISIRALTRRPPDETFSRVDNKLRWICGDLADSSTFVDLMVPGATLINLAYPESWARPAHIESTKRLAEAATQYALRRVIHCSTAVVVGNTRQYVVTETTEPSPQTEYEKTKLTIEQIWLASAEDNFDLVIARPSAVFGPQGKNLDSLAHALTHGSRFINYVRSSLYSRRQMNLVHVQNVVAAIEVLMDIKDPFNGGIFNVSNDDDPLNNFQDVERILMRELGVSNYLFPRFSSPQPILTALLHLAGRSNTNPDRVYDSTKLRRVGWRNDRDVESGLCEFAAWYLSQQQGV